MVDDAVYVRNAEAPWRDFSAEKYWQDNYAEVQPEDCEIIHRVSRFFIRVFTGRARAKRSIDVGTGSNLYPALLTLPWTDRILLTDYSENNVNWLRDHLGADDGGPWAWQPFWQELGTRQGYNQISEPRKQLREACAGGSGQGGIERRSVFELPAAQWELGTMFFVAESISEDVAEFQAAIDMFVTALAPGAPFAAAFMAGSGGYEVAGTHFPALSITSADVAERFTAMGVIDLSVHLNRTPYRVRPGYKGMIVATGVVGGR